jgi:hypothetical protein
MLSCAQQRVLWHQRLGHLNMRWTSTLHKFVKGIPDLPVSDELDACPVCSKAKLRKTAHGKTDSRRATRPNQGILIDFAHVVQDSKNKNPKVQLTGLYGETCYVLIAVHYSGKLYGEALRSKRPPLDFINRWLLAYGLPPGDPDKYVRMDLGGELG